MTNEAALMSHAPEHDFNFFMDTPAVYHCHHFNLFLDQTIDDALGQEDSTRIRTEAAREAFHLLLASCMKRTGLKDPADRLKASCELFAAMGHGKIEIQSNYRIGTAKGSHLHYGFTWKDKYDGKGKRRHSADAVAAGFTAAAVEVAFGLPRESVNCKEIDCISLGDPACTFQVSSGTQEGLMPPVGRREVMSFVKPTFRGLHEDKIVEISNDLKKFLATIKADERGLVQGFGVFVTLHLTNYYNRISYNTLHLIEEKMPQAVPALESLLRESGHVCVFNTIGGIMLSPEWEGLINSPSGNFTETITACCAISRALGFGHWTIHEMAPGQNLVLRTPSNYETVYYRSRHGFASEGRCFFFQGAALAFMQLAERVPWRDKPELTQSFYADLFRRGVPWEVKETRCISRGDDFCEVVVSRK